MSDKVDYSNELTEIVVGLKDSLDKCITLITKISGENSNLKESNVTLNTKLDELTQEMANYTKVSFVSNLSKQISEKDYQIVTLKKKLCKLENDNSELVKEKEKIKITPNDDILIEVGENSSDKSTIITKPESDVSQVTQFIDSFNNKLETENKKAERQAITEESQSETDEEEEEEAVEEDQESDGAEVEEDQESDDEEDQESDDEEDQESDGEEVEEDQESDDESDGEEVEEDQESDCEEEAVEEDQESDDESDGEEVEFEIIKIKKKEYYLSNEEPPGIYAIESDDDVGDRIGDFIDNKLVKSTD
tara:strand:- start:20217 stop:21137 length:921 start_codon:yes stop_codon:yes gene_type:complete